MLSCGLLPPLLLPLVVLGAGGGVYCVPPPGFTGMYGFVRLGGGGGAEFMPGESTAPYEFPGRGGRL